MLSGDFLELQRKEKLHLHCSEYKDSGMSVLLSFVAWLHFNAATNACFWRLSIKIDFYNRRNVGTVFHITRICCQLIKIEDDSVNESKKKRNKNGTMQLSAVYGIKHSRIPDYGTFIFCKTNVNGCHNYGAHDVRTHTHTHTYAHKVNIQVL